MSKMDQNFQANSNPVLTNLIQPNPWIEFSGQIQQGMLSRDSKLYPWTWTREATRRLVDFRLQYFDDFEDSSKRKAEIWEKIAEQLASEGHDFPPHICDSKWRNLLFTYRRQESTGVCGKGPRTTWEYHNDFVLYFKKKAIIDRKKQGQHFKSPPSSSTSSHADQSNGGGSTLEFSNPIKQNNIGIESGVINKSNNISSIPSNFRNTRANLPEPQIKRQYNHKPLPQSLPPMPRLTRTFIAPTVTIEEVSPQTRKRTLPPAYDRNRRGPSPDPTSMFAPEVQLEEEPDSFEYGGRPHLSLQRKRPRTLQSQLQMNPIFKQRSPSSHQIENDILQTLLNEHRRYSHWNKTFLQEERARLTELENDRRRGFSMEIRQVQRLTLAINKLIQHISSPPVESFSSPTCDVKKELETEQPHEENA